MATDANDEVLFEVTCPECGKKGDVPASALGKKAKCPGCKQVVFLLADDSWSGSIEKKEDAPDSKERQRLLQEDGISDVRKKKAREDDDETGLRKHQSTLILLLIAAPLTIALAIFSSPEYMTGKSSRRRRRSSSSPSGGSGSYTTSPVRASMDEAKKNLIIKQMKEYDLVRDAAIVEKGEKVKLVLIVDNAANYEYAKSLGDSFLRLYISLSDQEGKNLGKTIGPTKLDYLIGVYTPQEKQIALGGKASIGHSIVW